MIDNVLVNKERRAFSLANAGTFETVKYSTKKRGLPDLIAPIGSVLYIFLQLYNE